MKKFLLFALVVFFGHAQAQIVSNPYNPTRIGDFMIQNGKIYYVKDIGMHYTPQNYKTQILKNDTPNEAIKVNMTANEGLKGTFVNFPLDWASLGLKNKKLDAFLMMPFNATFEIIKEGQGYQLKVTNIWFKDVIKSTGKTNLTLEDIVCDKKGIMFSKDKKHVRALTILNMNLDDVFLPRSTF